MSLGINTVYLIIAVLLSLLLAAQADHRLWIAIFLLWLLTSPVLLQPGVLPRIGALGFDLQPTRILWLILLPALVLSRLAPELVRKRSFASLAAPEKILIAYLLLSVLSISINYQTLGIREAINIGEKQLAFGVLYFAARDYMGERDYSTAERGIVLLAIFSACVAILQFVYNPNFFRVAETYKGAFGDVARSTGAFGAEYEHSMYVTFAVIIVGLRKKSFPMWQWICLTGLLGISVVLTFTRMPWAVFILAVLGVLIIRYWNKPLGRNLWIVIMGMVLAVVVWIPWSEVIARYLPVDFVTGRLFADTLTNRLGFNELAISLLPKYPLGLGATVESPVYNREFYDFGLGVGAGGIGYTVHNGFLSAAVRYGIAGGIIFACMLFGYLAFSARRAVVFNSETLILPLVMAILILYNLTLDFSAANGQIVLIVGWLLGCLAGQTLYHQRSINGSAISFKQWIERKPSDPALNNA